MLAGVLAFIALLFLAAIAYLYVHEACSRSPIPLRRVTSDMMRLIPSVESLAYPNPVSDDLRKCRPPSAPGAAADGMGANEHGAASAEDAANRAAEKKRVRFNDS